MSTTGPRTSPVSALPKGRVEAFSDGVFAVAITLLVLYITLAHHAGRGRLWAELGELKYVDDRDQAQLDRYFHLDTAARELVDIRRGEHNRLGVAVQIGTVRFLGTFLADPTDVPWAVAAHLAAQLGIANPGVLKQYAAREGTNRLHTGEIQHAYGYRDFADPAVHADLVGWLEARTRLASERLLESKVLLPGPTVLARLVASVRDQAATRLWQDLAAAPDAGQRTRLEGLLVVPAGERSSTLDRLRRGPTSVTATGLLGALHRLEEIRALGVGELDLSFAPPGRLDATHTPPSFAEDEVGRPVVGMVLFPGMTLLDLVGPHTAFSPSMKVHLIAATMDDIVCDTGVRIRPQTTFTDAPQHLDVLFVPGGAGTASATLDTELLDFLTERGTRARYVTAVCTGSIVLGAAGLLDGYQATTHWTHLGLLELFGAHPREDRVVIDRNRITGGGVTASIDFGLTVLERLQGRHRSAASSMPGHIPSTEWNRAMFAIASSLRVTTGRRTV